MSDFLISDFFLLVRFHILRNRFDDCRTGICEGWEYSAKPQQSIAAGFIKLNVSLLEGKLNTMPNQD
jgi:hypothetical protein